MSTQNLPNHWDWLEWAGQNGIHPYIIEYIGLLPDHLWKQPPKTEEPFSTPRSWHILSDAIYSYGDNVTDKQPFVDYQGGAKVAERAGREGRSLLFSAEL